ncbi:MAG TPA: tyrosine-type recombinase/integrase [Candidatus Deferrimicrobiaceae bacterium]|jgi:integrase/recombinase XerD
MSSVFKRVSKSGKTSWYVSITYQGQRYKVVGGDTKGQALARLRELEGRIERNKKLRDRKVPFDLLADEYLAWAATNLAPRTCREREIIIRVHLKPFFTGLANEIVVRDVEFYKTNRLAKGIAAETMNNELKTLSGIFKYGIENEYLDSMPKIRRLSVPRKSPVYLNEAEIAAVLAAATPAVRMRLQVLFFTGLRKAELAHLHIEDVDLEGRLLHVRARNGWTPKNKKDRSIPLNQPAYEALEVVVKKRLGAQDGNTLLFPGHRPGKHLSDIRGGLNAACERSGVKRVKIHNTRSTFGTLMAAYGADVVSITSAMGHADLRSSMPYLGVVEARTRVAIEALGAIKVPAMPEHRISPAVPKLSHSEKKTKKGNPA